MKALPTARRLLTLNALFARRPLGLEARTEPADTRMPEPGELQSLQALAGPQLARRAAEAALQEGSCRHYPPRRESELVDKRP